MNYDLWNEINQIIDNSLFSVDLIHGNEEKGKLIIDKLELNENTFFANVILKIAGIKIDNCIRILGQGDNQIVSIQEINAFELGMPNKIKGMLIVAHDIFGGFFAMNIGAMNEQLGIIFYFAPDTLNWESLDMNYSQFFQWCMLGNVDEFYESLRWNGWKEIAQVVDFNNGILFYPFLWSKEFDINTVSKKIVPFDELFNINMDYRKKFFN